MPIKPDRQWQRTTGTMLLALTLVAFAGLLAKLIYIGTAGRAALLAVAKRQQESRSVVPSRRGSILDRRGRVLATTRFLPDVFIDAKVVADPGAFAAELGARINVAPERLLKRIRAHPDSRFLIVARRVDPVTAEAVAQMKQPGVGLSPRAARVYPMGTSLAHVLGFVGADGHGLEGIELALDEHLAGRDGRIESIRDAKRRALWHGEHAGRPPVDGGSLVLTVDAEIQRVTEAALEQSVTEFEARSGVAIVMAPATGEILAMACYPTFDPNKPMSVPAGVRRNRAITDPVEPGSTFKPFIASGALDRGLVTLTEKIDCHMGRFRFGNRLVQDTHPYGLLDLTGIITKSSNIGMGQIAQRMGNDLLYETIKGFGFGTRTGIELVGECSGIVHSLSKWNDLSTTSVSFGYEVSVTPLQLITGLCCLINDGVLIKPHLVKELCRPDGTVVRSHTGAEMVRRVVRPEVARYMVQTAMVSVVEHGGARTHFQGPYRALGKTGTVKLLKPDHSGYEPGAYLSTFMGAAPVRNPRVAAVVMVRRPNMEKGYYGATVAAPAVSTILGTTLAYLQVPTDRQVAMGP